MVQPIKWTQVVRLELNMSNLQQAACVKLGENGIYYAVVIDNPGEHFAIEGFPDFKAALIKAHDFAEVLLARRIKEAEVQRKETRREVTNRAANQA